MVTSIKDPDALAEAACRVNLISPDALVTYRYITDTQAKTRSLLQIIEGKVKGHSNFFHEFLTVLRRLPGLSQLVSLLLESYGRLIISDNTIDTGY